MSLAGGPKEDDFLTTTLWSKHLPRWRSWQKRVRQVTLVRVTSLMKSLLSSAKFQLWSRSRST